MSSVRWAFNLSKWEPSEHEFSLAVSCLQLEEKNRIDRFVYKKDVKASLIGRLMMRKFISESTGVPYDSVKLIRDANNKPAYNGTTPDIPEVSFNISHQGSFTVLAGEPGNRNIGVDVMKFEYNGGKTIEEFFRIMNRNFSISEWQQIRGTSQTSEQNKLANFCRNWTLKESYVKALGIGLTTDLCKLSFDIHSNLQEDQIISDTHLYINDEKQDFIFEESLLDPSHCVAVALEHNISHSKSSLSNSIFNKITPAKLFENVIPLVPQDFEYTKRYFAKDPCPS